LSATKIETCVSLSALSTFFSASTTSFLYDYFPLLSKGCLRDCTACIFPHQLCVVRLHRTRGLSNLRATGSRQASYWPIPKIPHGPAPTCSFSIFLYNF
jgi:hypothetical protein